MPSLLRTAGTARVVEIIVGPMLTQLSEKFFRFIQSCFLLSEKHKKKISKIAIL